MERCIYVYVEHKPEKRTICHEN